MPGILVGVDFSPPSRRALDAAAGLARDLRAPLVLVHAFEPVPAPAPRGRMDPISKVKAEINASDAVDLSGWAAEARRHAEVETVGREGKAADVILEEAKRRKVALIVVGSHGLGGIKRAMLGSVADDVVRRSPIPVVVVPSG